MRLSQLTNNSVGLGLRSQFINELLERHKKPVDFLEVAPENWLNIGGLRQKKLQALAEAYPIYAHGLSLSIGGPHPIDFELLKNIKQFLSQYSIAIYSEHLSFCRDEKGYLYDLLPIPFCEAMLNYISERIQSVQDYLGKQIALENSSYYCAPNQEMAEGEFINALIKKADCKLLLDINNVYVNSQNHNYCPYQFIDTIPFERISYLHIAGHDNPDKELLIDTHGNKVDNDTWKLLAYFYQQKGIKPTLLERDNNIPPLEELLQETDIIQSYQANYESITIRNANAIL